ncbi:hypothetical protein IAU59_004067 [Kwoniella sp. CBS 9459]
MSSKPRSKPTTTSTLTSSFSRPNPRKSKSTKPDPPPISPSQIASQSLKLFAPNFRPQRLVKDPKPPSLAWSKLPPPAAEVDERPKARSRRFRVWGQVTPGLRKVVLDPRKRIHLRRYQPFAIPATPQPKRRKALPLALPIPTSPGSPSLIPDKSIVDWTTPVRVPRFRENIQGDSGNDAVGLVLVEEKNKPLFGAGGLLTPPTSPRIDQHECRTDHGLGSSRKCSDLTCTGGGEEPAQPSLPSPPLTPTVTAHPSEPKAKPSLTVAFKGGAASRDLSAPPHQPSLAPASAPAPAPTPAPAPMNRPTPPWCDKSLPKRTRKVAWQQLLEYRWILDQEHERRFRAGMRIMMDRIMEWQKQNALPFSQWSKGQKWQDCADKAAIHEHLAFFKAIRKRSLNISNYLPPILFMPVPGKVRVDKMIQDEEQRRKAKKERKAARKAGAPLQQSLQQANAQILKAWDVASEDMEGLGSNATTNVRSSFEGPYTVTTSHTADESTMAPRLSTSKEKPKPCKSRTKGPSPEPVSKDANSKNGSRVVEQERSVIASKSTSPQKTRSRPGSQDAFTTSENRYHPLNSTSTAYSLDPAPSSSSTQPTVDQIQTPKSGTTDFGFGHRTPQVMTSTPEMDALMERLLHIRRLRRGMEIEEPSQDTAPSKIEDEDQCSKDVGSTDGLHGLDESRSARQRNHSTIPKGETEAHSPVTKRSVAPLAVQSPDMEKVPPTLRSALSLTSGSGSASASEPDSPTDEDDDEASSKGTQDVRYGSLNMDDDTLIPSAARLGSEDVVPLSLSPASRSTASGSSDDGDTVTVGSSNGDNDYHSLSSTSSAHSRANDEDDDADALRRIEHKDEYESNTWNPAEDTSVLPHARILGHSKRKAHPNRKLALIILDGDGNAHKGPEDSDYDLGATREGNLEDKDRGTQMTASALEGTVR